MIEELKKIAGEAAAERVKDGMLVGLGTGSTVKYTILKLGQMVSEGMDIVAVPTSRDTERLARDCGIKLTTLEEVDMLDLTIDGADEVDSNLNLIKGGGGALLREKMVAYYSRYEIIVVDERKISHTLGSFALPVEIVKFGARRTMRRLSEFGCSPALRGGEKPFITDNGNYIVDCKFESITEPEKLSTTLNNVPGVVENGLFIGLAKEVYVGTKNGVKILKSRE
ncbi:MAG: ribose-5-phosphate isomerase RpiA [Euryarchaeota archaeon]|nr:ribose-5-phosphate isomerase RpiA [Euryarchaeota archaeon]